MIFGSWNEAYVGDFIVQTMVGLQVTLQEKLIHFAEIQVSLTATGGIKKHEKGSLFSNEAQNKTKVLLPNYFDELSVGMLE
jgi:hypothetical protein